MKIEIYTIFIGNFNDGVFDDLNSKTIKISYSCPRFCRRYKYLHESVLSMSDVNFQLSFCDVIFES